MPIGIRQSNKAIKFPQPTHNASAVANFAGAKELCFDITPLFASSLKQHTTVWDAISDLPPIESGSRNEMLDYAKNPGSALIYGSEKKQPKTAIYCRKVSRVA